MQEQVEIPEAVESGEKTEKPEAIKISSFTKGIGELVDLYTCQKEASEDYAASVKAIAEASGLRPSVIRRAVRAKVTDKISETKEEAEQLLLAL